LREAARRAGVSHHAPYNHFPEKRDRESALLLAAICRTYVRLGLENPALYRLMFGQALSETGSAERMVVGGLRPPRAGDLARG
jgi:AcrR family transcriptional regulator